MAIKRIVSTEFWTDKKVVEQFTPEDKLFFLYLLTNPHTTQLGIYPFIPKVAAFEIGYSKDAVLSLIERFERYEIIMFSTSSGEIAVKNYLKHSIVKGGTPVYDLLVKEANLVKDKSLLRFILSANSDSLNDTVRKFINDMEKDNENEKENDNDNDNEDSVPNRYVSRYDSLKSNVKDNSFDIFWEAYPLKKSKQDARKAFESMRKRKDAPTIERLVASVETHKKSIGWQKDGGQYIPHPATYLRKGMYDDELSVSVESKGQITADYFESLKKGDKKQ